MNEKEAKINQLMHANLDLQSQISSLNQFVVIKDDLSS